jgi:carbonic anhydrase
VVEQSANVCKTTIVEDAWRRGQALVVHGWVYDLQDGLLEDLTMTVAQSADLVTAYDKALAGVHARYARAGAR